ncbi:MAG: hypothetical protein IE885_06535 [Campylobacterales bacterium]|nr:hypothetical protein [Campylobacterales bacterium]
MIPFYKSFSQKNKPKLFTFHFSFFTLLLLVAVTGCGYKPSSHAISNLFSDTVYIEVHVDRVEPENAPFLKDEMNRMVYTRFGGKVVPKEQAQSQIIVTYAGTTFTPLAYKNGYVSRYRTNVSVNFEMLTKQGKLTKRINAIQEADIQTSSLLSTTLRIQAIHNGLEKAMDEFLAYASAKGLTLEHEK